MLKVTNWKCAFFAAGILLFSALPVFAEQVVSAEAENQFVLADGRKIRMAGLQIPSESGALISVLLAGKEVQLQEEDAPGLEGRVYIEVDTDELPFPFADELHQKKRKVVVNELLLAMGAAYVDETQDFKMKDRFLEIQNEARTAGKGIWSYEEHAV